MLYSFIFIYFIFLALFKQITKAIYKRFLFSKYRQCIIIAPVIRRNFLYISFIFYGFISYIFLYFLVLFLMYFLCVLWFYWSNYRGYTQVVSFFKYRQCLIILPGVRTRIYAFVAPASRLRVRYTNHLLTRRCITN